MNAIQTIGLFVVAGLAELSGAYLIWQWIRADKPAFWGLVGLIALLVYAVTQTFQAFSFGRAFAAYGGIFITLALLWGWLVDRRVPDRWDWLGVGLCLAGAAAILWGPRR